MSNFFMETSRLGFSYWNREDINLACSLWKEPMVTKYISRDGIFTDNDIRNRLMLEVNNGNMYGVQYWTIFELRNNEFIGCCGLRPYNLRERIYELGFHLKSQYWGQGFGMEAAEKVIESI